LSKDELHKVIQKAVPHILLVDGEEYFEFVQNENAIDYRFVELIEFIPTAFDYSKMEDVILILFTSGSTGEPKGVTFHGEMLLTNMIETCRNWGLISEDTTLVETPFFHTGGYNVLLLPLLLIGGTAIIAKNFDPLNVFKMIEEEKVSVYFGVPTMFQLLLDHPVFNKTNFSSIRFFISGGAACSVVMISEYQKRNILFKQGFGLTEIGPNCFLLDSKDAVLKVGSIGKPMPHTQVRVISSDGKDCHENQTGELILKGPHLTRTYYKNHKAYEDSLFEGFFRTGDLVQFDSDGFFYVVGRIKDMYISGGENVYPGEVENVILENPLIHRAVVVSVPNEKWGEVGFLFITSDREFDLIEIKDFLQPRLSRYKHPHFLKRMDAFPLLPNGKIDRVALKKKASVEFSLFP
jgi:fatty-acyl-CoA synthase